MNQITTFPLALAANGWAKTNQCANCGGIEKVYFINTKYPNYTLEWWPKYYSFKVTYTNKTVQPQTPIGKLDSYLKEFATNYRIEQAAKEANKTETVPIKKGTTKPVDTIVLPETTEAGPIEAEPTDETTKTSKKTSKK